MQVDVNGTAWAQAFTNPNTAADPNTAYTVGMWVKAPLGSHYFGPSLLMRATLTSALSSGRLKPAPAPGSMSLQAGQPPWHGIDFGLVADASAVAQTIYVDDVILQTAAPTPIDVLANDSDGGDGGPFQIDSVTQPAHGTVAITGGGSGLTYQPNAGYCNDGNPTDDFTYTLNGGSTATVAVSVTCGP